MPAEHGQATIEWTGLVLLVALALSALGAFVSRVEGRGLGGVLANSISCAARGACAPERASPAPSERAESRAARPALSVRREAAAFNALRGVRQVAQRVWIVCLGYRRYRYELQHPRAPTEAMPLEEARDIANECLNPLEFLVGD
jgi:hypothetical protein